MLADHEHVIPINEPQIGLHLAPFLSDWPGWDPPHLDETFTVNKLAEQFHIYFFSRAYERVWLPALRRLIIQRIAVYGDKTKTFAIKEPNGSQAADVLSRALPRSRILFLLRDGRDVVDSELAAAARGSWLDRRYGGFRGIQDHERKDFVTQASWKWVWRTKVVSETIDAHAGPTRTVRYEELLADTPGQLREIVGWLALPTAPVADIVNQHMFNEIPNRGPREFARSASPGGWRKNLTRSEQDLVHEIMGPTLRAFDYA
ncbi:MAG: sulfotransferase [Actinomycetota bacterium]|nr:sulfotransferase [Actinomycetota bacterium]